jgi:fused signal recognition particle receptor
VELQDFYIGFFALGSVLALGILGFLVVIFIKSRRQPELPEARPPSERGEPQGITGAEPVRSMAPEKPAPKKDIRSLLAKTQEAFTSKLDALLLSTKQIDAGFVDSLEELLYTGDLGPKTVEKLLTSVRGKLSRGELKDPQAVKGAMYDEIMEILNAADHAHSQATGPSPWVILVVGVNGVGKTTSIGKLAHHYATQGKKVLVVAGDTFRAAAEQQLSVWGERANVDVYTSPHTKDAAAVAYEGIQKGLAEKAEVIIVDTAGRLHTKEGLMEELKKVKRVMDKALAGAPHETLLVIDANSGQNALVQARQFNDALGVTGLVVTKLDGTARGGVIVGIASEVGLGVQYVGLGEKINDLQTFSGTEYAKGLLRI